MKTTLLVACVVLLAAVTALFAWVWTPDQSREALEATYLQQPADLVEVAGTVLHVRDSGPVAGGKTIIMVHGLGAHLQTWDGWTDALKQTARVVRFDLPGAGLSPPDTTGDYSDERTIDLILALMDQRELAEAVLVGNSIGGRIAWRFAAAYAERTAGLVLVSPDGFASPGFEYGTPAEVPAMMNLMTVALPKSILRQNLQIAYSDPSKLTDQTMERYYDLMRAPGSRQALLDRMRQTVLVPPEPILATIKAPVLLVWGADDAMIPVANAQDYLAALPDARLAVLPSLGHVPHEEDAATSVVPVIEFLSELGR